MWISARHDAPQQRFHSGLLVVLEPVFILGQSLSDKGGGKTVGFYIWWTWAFKPALTVWFRHHILLFCASSSGEGRNTPIPGSSWGLARRQIKLWTECPAWEWAASLRLRCSICRPRFWHTRPQANATNAVSRVPLHKNDQTLCVYLNNKEFLRVPVYLGGIQMIMSAWLGHIRLGAC